MGRQECVAASSEGMLSCGLSWNSHAREVNAARMYACKASWRVDWDGEMNHVPWTVWVLQTMDIQRMEVKSGMTAWGLQPGSCELVNEVNPHSLSSSLETVGSVFNSCLDYFRKWVSGQNDNEVQPQRVFLQE